MNNTFFYCINFLSKNKFYVLSLSRGKRTKNYHFAPFSSFPPSIFWSFAHLVRQGCNRFLSFGLFFYLSNTSLISTVYPCCFIFPRTICKQYITLAKCVGRQLNVEAWVRRTIYKLLRNMSKWWEINLLTSQWWPVLQIRIVVFWPLDPDPYSWHARIRIWLHWNIERFFKVKPGPPFSRMVGPGSEFWMHLVYD